MAHALLNYVGACRNIHGHTYKLEVCLIGSPLQKPLDPIDGLLIDFKVLKEIVKVGVLDKLDHALVLNRHNEDLVRDNPLLAEQKLVFTDFQPTCENLCSFIAEELLKLIPANCDLFSIKLYETSNSFAEWFASDQKCSD